MKASCVSLVLLALLFATAELHAQIPRTLSYQGVLTDTLGNPRPNGIVTFTFRLYETPTGGTAIWTEIKDLQVRRGLFFTSLGDITPFGAGVGFDRPYWLAIQPGSEPELSPRIPLTSVGYSFSAIKSDTAQFALTAPQQTYVDSARVAGTVPDNSVTSAKILDGTITGADISPTAALNITSLTATGNVGIGTTSPGDKLTLGLGSARVDMSTNQRDRGYEWALNGVRWFGINYMMNTDLLSFVDWTVPTERVVITRTGNVGIGTTTPNEQLEITGNLRLPVSTASVGVIKSGGNRFIHNFGTDNFFAGVNAGNLTMTGFGGNTGVGVNALFSNTTGNYNTANGVLALYSNTTGYGNTANGVRALYSNTTGNYNTANGYQALYSNTTGFENTANGVNALYSNTTGYYNTANGRSALSSNTTGFNNTALGYSAGSNVTTGSNLTLIGYDAEPTSASATNQITLGNSAVTSLRCAVTTITALSDARDKKNIQELSLGLDFISKLKPRQFNWDKREWYENTMSDGSKMQNAPTAGFIAQELDEAQTAANAEWLNLVLKDNPEKLEATPGNLLPIMVKAIQELGAENKELRAKNEELSGRFAELEAMVKLLVEQRQDGEKKSIGELR